MKVLQSGLWSDRFRQYASVKIQISGELNQLTCVAALGEGRAGLSSRAPSAKPGLRVVASGAVLVVAAGPRLGEAARSEERRGEDKFHATHGPTACFGIFSC